MARNRWVRDGTIVCGGQTRIDLRSTRAQGGEYAWITIKGRTDAETERLAARLLVLLSPREDSDGR